MQAEDTKDDAPERITREDLQRAEREGLQDPASLSIFLTWYQLGGPQHGITLTEAVTMSAELRNDIFYLLRELHRMRRNRSRTKAKSKKTP